MAKKRKKQKEFTEESITLSLKNEKALARKWLKKLDTLCKQINSDYELYTEDDQEEITPSYTSTGLNLVQEQMYSVWNLINNAAIVLEEVTLEKK